MEHTNSLVVPGPGFARHWPSGFRGPGPGKASAACGIERRNSHLQVAPFDKILEPGGQATVASYRLKFRFLATALGQSQVSQGHPDSAGCTDVFRQVGQPQLGPKGPTKEDCTIFPLGDTLCARGPVSAGSESATWNGPHAHQPDGGTGGDRVALVGGDVNG